MHRLDRVTRRPFVVFPHVNQHDLGMRGEFGARLGHADFVDVFFGVADELEKTG